MKINSEINILSKVSELGGAAALVYLASFVYGFLELQAYYGAFGLKWYVPFLPTNYFSMHAASTICAIMLMALAYGVTLRFFLLSLSLAKVLSFVVIIYLVIIIIATYFLREKSFESISELTRLCKITLIPSTHILAMGIALIIVKHKDLAGSKVLGVMLVCATVMIFYAAPLLRGEARAVEVMRSYGDDLPLVEVDSKKWSVLAVFEDKALALNFPRHEESHPIATFITIDKAPITFASPGYVGDGYLKK